MRLSALATLVLSILFSLFSTFSSASPLSAQRRALSFDYNGQKVRGVNLGGWFVLEPWITPSLFAADNGPVDEYTFCQALGSAECHNRLSAHWNSWIVESDFHAMAAAGLNHARIPIGYWAITPLPGDPYVQGQLEVLDRAVGWARSAGLKLLLDLHGVPGSQNGFDNSGRRGAISWLQGNTANQAKAAIDALAARYASAGDVVTAVELVNEPAGTFGLSMDGIKQFYRDGWGAVRVRSADAVVVIHDAFQQPTYWNGVMNTASGMQNVMLDTHQYQIFSDAEVARSPAQHVAAACAIGRMLRLTDKWTVVGEWTGAQTDCAKWLNGHGVGARYDGSKSGSHVVGSCNGKNTGTVDALSADDKHNLRMYIEAQLDAYEQHTGWFFWTWRTESSPEWDMKALLAGGIFPQPLTARKFPNQCGF